MSSDEVFEAISHPIRIAILKQLEKKPLGFADLKRKLKIKSSGKLDFHLKKMDTVITTNKGGQYTLNDRGYAALRAVYIVSNYGWQRRAWLINLATVIFLNVYTFFSLPEFFIFSAVPTIGWLIFYSYWTFVKRGVRLRENGGPKDD